MTRRAKAVISCYRAFYAVQDKMRDEKHKGIMSSRVVLGVKSHAGAHTPLLAPPLAFYSSSNLLSTIRVALSLTRLEVVGRNRRAVAHAGGHNGRPKFGRVKFVQRSLKDRPQSCRLPF
jgi:hypothetical protein